MAAHSSDSAGAQELHFTSVCYQRGIVAQAQDVCWKNLWLRSLASLRSFLYRRLESRADEDLQINMQKLKINTRAVESC